MSPNIFRDNIECNLGPFQVECRKRNPGFGDKLKEMWSGCAEVIDISTDKDCFLYIMNYYLGLSWRSQSVPKKRQSGFEPPRERAACGNREAATETQAFSLSVQNLRVLGLDDSATNMDVRTAYRDLARKHHPDLLRAQGCTRDDIENAEEIMKVINSAYEWLENDAGATT